MTPEEKDLISRAARGNPSAINEVVERYSAFVNRIAWQIVRNSADAADATQEVLIRLLASLHTLEAVESFQTWLYRIAYRVSLNSRRARERRREDVEAKIDEWPADDVEDAQQREARLAEIGAAADALPYPHRLIVRMFYFEDRSCREIAGMLGTTENNVKVQLHRARAMLRERLASSSTHP